MVQLLHALEHAHAKGVIHRDVKPSNILCHSAASIKVADFGIAQINTLDLTRTGRFGIVGTPNYMAPERFIGRPDDARGDLYSAGVVLFQLLTGQTPFTATDTHELMNKILNAEPASAQALRPGLSDAWVAVTKRSLARNPDDRYQTAREFLDELRAALNAEHQRQHAVARPDAILHGDSEGPGQERVLQGRHQSIDGRAPEAGHAGRARAHACHVRRPDRQGCWSSAPRPSRPMSSSC